jgi:hypothetical protein
MDYFRMKYKVKDYLRIRYGLNDTQITLATILESDGIKEGAKEDIDPESVAEAVYENYKLRYGL